MPPKISNMLVQSFSKVCAGMMELVDMTDSKSVAFGRGGSSTPTGTTALQNQPTRVGFFMSEIPYLVPIIVFIHSIADY